MSLRYRLMEWRGRSIYNGYCDRHKCVFIHIPKNAGTSVVDSLFGCDSRHVPWTEYDVANPKKFQRYFKFAFVRNPWDRVLSAYTFLSRGGMNEADAQWAAENISQFKTFESFVCEWVNERSIWEWVHFKPQHHWICDSRLKSKMDFLGRMESLDSDFQSVCHQLNLRRELPVRNRTRSSNYTEAYTPRMAEIIRDAYRVDIELFNYSFGETQKC